MSMFSIKFKPNITTLCWLIIVPYIFIDAISGFFAQEIGVNIRLSLVLKIILLLLSLLCLIRWQSKYLLFVSFISIHILISLYYSVIQNGQEALVNELPFALKVILLVVMYAFAMSYARQEPLLFIKRAKACLTLGFWVVVFNVMLGYFNIGYYTYPNEGGIGFKGFFVAGNELSALFIVLSCFKLHDVWNAFSLKKYIINALLVLFIGLSIGTKSVILFSLFVVFVIPFFNFRKKIISFKAFALIVVAILLMIAILFFLYNWLDTFRVGQRLLFKFSKFSIVDMVFSGRNIWATQVYERISDADGVIPLFFGYGSVALEGIIGKASLEIDPIDIFLYFGIVPALLLTVWSLFIIVLNVVKLNENYYAPSALVANFALLLFACIAGHVWTSGMLGIAWALLNGLAALPFKQLPPKKIIREII